MQMIKTFEAGKIDGRRKVVEKYNDYLHGNIGITSESITLKNFMTAWLENVVALNVKASSMQTYRTLFKTRIVPRRSENSRLDTGNARQMDSRFATGGLVL